MHLFELKKALISTPVLVLPNFRAQFVLDTDASADGLRTILSQVVSGRVRMNVITYASRMLTRVLMTTVTRATPTGTLVL